MRRGVEIFAEWVDEMVRAYEKREAMLADLADRALAAAEAAPAPAVIVRWTCDKPTAAPENELYVAARLTEDVPFGELMRRWLQLR